MTESPTDLFRVWPCAGLGNRHDRGCLGATVAVAAAAAGAARIAVRSPSSRSTSAAAAEAELDAGCADRVCVTATRLFGLPPAALSQGPTSITATGCRRPGLAVCAARRYRHNIGR